MKTVKKHAISAVSIVERNSLIFTINDEFTQFKWVFMCKEAIIFGINKKLY